MATINADGLLDAFERYAVAKLERCGELFANEVETNAPKRTRRLVDSIEQSTVTVYPDRVSMTVRVTATSDDGAPYPAFQNEGTGIFGPDGVPITPKKPGGVLVFDWPAAGGIVFAKSVRGTEPTRFWDKAVDAWPDIVSRVERGG
jgi:hypothetical protein